MFTRTWRAGFSIAACPACLLPPAASLLLPSAAVPADVPQLRELTDDEEGRENVLRLYEPIGWCTAQQRCFAVLHSLAAPCAALPPGGTAASQGGVAVTFWAPLFVHPAPVCTATAAAEQAMAGIQVGTAMGQTNRSLSLPMFVSCGSKAALCMHPACLMRLLACRADHHKAAHC